MNTERMNEFPAQVNQTPSDAFVVAILDGASSHESRYLRVPENLRLHRLPGYSPKLNQ
ncbi:MAG: hypothetical protein WCV00_17855 [Verrucomicrobiia bacterium]|jgi:hypothetical protein